MKTQIRLNSVVPNGVSGPEAAAIDLIYAYLLFRNNQSFYRYISINQIGEDLDEVILKDGNKVYANVRYESPRDFIDLTDFEKNVIRLEILHTGMTRIANEFKKLDVTLLENIRQEILNQRFLFDIPGKKFINKKNKNLFASITITPAPKLFEYHLQINHGDKVICKHLIYRGLPNTFYTEDLFSTGQWQKEDSFTLSGKRKEIEITVKLSDCSLEYANLTPFEKAPMFEMFRMDNSDEDRAKAQANFERTINPGLN